MRTHRLALALLLVEFGTSAYAQTSRSQTLFRSATIARDVGGFELGTPIADVRKIVPVEAVGDGNYQAVRDGITYDFGVTRLGRIYRVASSQNLGRFDVDATFLANIASRLSAKYGSPTDRSSQSWNWELIEPVKRTSGQTLPVKTMWASAYLNRGSDGIGLEVKLLDFRIMWEDEAKLNRSPRDRALNSAKF